MVGAGGRRLGRRGRSVLALALITVLVGPAGTTHAGYSPPTLLRTFSEVSVAAVAAKGAGVGVVWEEPRAIGPAILYRISRDGGATFGGLKRLDDRPNRRPSADVCMGSLWIASELRLPEDPENAWAIVVDSRQLDGTGYSGEVITWTDDGVVAMEPAVACVGSRFLALTWLQNKNGAGWRAKLRVYDPSPPMPDVAGPVYARTLDLGPADPDIEPSVAATNGRVVVAWGRSGDLWFRTAAIAAGTNVSLDPSPVVLLAGDVAHDTAIAIDGSRVVAAYQHHHDLYTIRSASAGARFSGARKRLDGDALCCWIGYPMSVDIVGSRVLLEGQRAYGDADPAVEEWRFRSSDGGATFSAQQVGSLGQRAGAYAGPATAPRIVEAWDDWTQWAGDNHVWFHRKM